MNLDEVKKAIDAFANLPASASVSESRDVAILALKSVQRECQRVQEKSNDYPSNPITADVWLDGAVLGPMAESLATLLNRSRLYDLEEKAQTLRCMAVLAVQSHYHHIVGPAMIARAECNERLGNGQLAGQIYQAVVADFGWIADEWAAAQEAPAGEDRVSLECLLRALEGVRRFRLEGMDTQATESLHQRCSGVLTRGEGAAPDQAT
jgi:hypothetical protein